MEGQVVVADAPMRTLAHLLRACSVAEASCSVLMVVAAASWVDERIRWVQPYWKGSDPAAIIERT